MMTATAPLTRAQALDATLFRCPASTEAHRRDVRAETGTLVSLCGLAFVGKVLGGSVSVIDAPSRCAACEALFEAAMARVPEGSRGGRESALAERAAREWSLLAEEPVTAEEIGGALYAFGSELACLRLEHKFGSPNARAAYSKPRGSWFFCVEPRP